MLNILIQWDCLEVMKSIPDGSIDAIITDPPYWTTACKWDSVIPFEPLWKELKRIIKPNGAIILFGSEPFSSALRMSNIKMYKYDWIWDKMKWSGSMLAKIMPMKSHENVIVFWSWRLNYCPIMELSEKKNIRDRQKNYVKPYTWSVYWETKWYIWNIKDDTRYPKSIIELSSQSSDVHQSKKLHPTQKPVALIEYLIKTYTNEWETVLDFTAGSWTTWVACINTNRNYILIEKDEWYCNIIRKRLASSI
jgi:site-specific DNA-methyltransferase (adenine-specific)